MDIAVIVVNQLYSPHVSFHNLHLRMRKFRQRAHEDDVAVKCRRQLATARRKTVREYGQDSIRLSFICNDALPPWQFPAYERMTGREDVVGYVQRVAIRDLVRAEQRSNRDMGRDENLQQ